MNDPFERLDPTQAEYFKDIVATIREPLLVLDAGLRVLAANRSFYKFFKVQAGETIGRLVYDLGDRQWDIPSLRTLLETILPQKALFNDYQVEHDFPSLGRRILLLNARRIPAPPKKATWILLAFEDVTEHKELERKLQASEQRFRAAFETAYDGMLLVDKTGGQIVNSNQSAQDLLGYSSKALQNKSLWELGILKDAGQFRQTSLELEEQGVLGLADLSIPTRGGGHFPADVYLTDRVAVIQCNIRDISERKKTEEALQESEEKYRGLVEQSLMGIGLSRGNQVIFANPALLHIFGFDDFEEFARIPLLDHVAPASRDQIAAQLKMVAQGENQRTNFEYDILRKDGTAKTLYASSTHITIGGEVYTQTAFHDITARKQAEENLEQERMLLRTLIDNLPDRIYVKDVLGRKILANKADWQASGGKKMEDILGKTDLETYPPELAQSFWAADKLLIDSGIPIINREEAGLDSQGKPVNILSTKVPLRDGQGKTIGLVGIGRDITERKRAEDQVRQLNEELEQRVEERTRDLREAQEQLVRKERLATLGEVASSIGHELRNPLGIISGAIYYLQMVLPDADGKIRQYHQLIERETLNAGRIITELLDFARVSGTQPQSLSVPELVQRVLERFPPPAPVRLALRLPAGLPPVFADPYQVEQVLGNLVMNAWQAIPAAGRVTISARLLKGRVAIAVKDTGTGIPPENMPKLFDPLFTTKASGIGLGLAVSRKLAEANGGTIQVHSQVGKGSTFTLVLPVVSSESDSQIVG